MSGILLTFLKALVFEHTVLTWSFLLSVKYDHDFTDKIDVMKWCLDVLYSLWARSLFWSNVSCSASVLVFCYHFICSMMFDTVYICNTKWLFNPIMHHKSYLRLRIVGATAYINIKIKIKNLLLSYYVNYLLIDREKTKNIGGMYTQIYIYIYISVLYFFMNITCRSIQGLGLTEYFIINTCTFTWQCLQTQEEMLILTKIQYN